MGEWVRWTGTYLEDFLFCAAHSDCIDLAKLAKEGLELGLELGGLVWEAFLDGGWWTGRVRGMALTA